MKFEKELTLGVLLKRYKRFLADIELDDGAIVTAHVPNTGSMKSTSEPGSRVAVLNNDNPGRKLKWTLELVQSQSGHWVGVNTARSNRIVEEAVEKNRIPSLGGFETIRREIGFGPGSRLDFMLEKGKNRCYLEVKNVTYREGDCALFPDAVTVRGAKHLEDLAKAVKLGHRGVIFFLVNRSDCKFMSPAIEIDPDYGLALDRASRSGVELMAYQAAVTLKKIEIEKKLNIVLPKRAASSRTP